MTSKHHEGWTLWPNSRHANWNSVDTGPHRDLLDEVGKAVRAQNLTFGFYYSLLQWDRAYTSNPGTAQWTVADYVEHTMIPDLKDLITTYEPDVLYVDGEWDYPSDHWQTKPFLAWLFNESPVKDHVAVNDRWGNDCRGKHGGFYVCEYGGEVAGSCIGGNPTHPWTSHEGMGKSFGYNRIDVYKTPAYFVGLLVQSVAYGGHLQLNVGPTADGIIPKPQVEILEQMGRWLELNGKAIWDTMAAPFGLNMGCTRPTNATDGGSSKGSVQRRQCYTCSAAGLYVMTDGWPEELVFPNGTLPESSVKPVSLIGVDGELEVSVSTRDANRTTVVALPNVALDRLPEADIESGCFVFVVGGFEGCPK